MILHVAVFSILDYTAIKFSHEFLSHLNYILVPAWKVVVSGESLNIVLVFSLLEAVYG